MKRKKWSEQEEQSLLAKYSELQSSGTLSKMKTREKKFRPIADHINAAHHGADPAAFPFRWSWRDVSIKVQNMRHQYLCVKQKIRLSPDSPEFNWDDGDNHWENFLAYKSVFGDIDLDSRPTTTAKRVHDDSDDDDDSDDSDDSDDDSEAEIRAARRRRAEERREEEEMEWMEGMVAMQLHHEKEAMRIQTEACHAQMQVLAAMARLVSQFFAGAGAGDMGGVLPPQGLDDLGGHHPGGDNGKPNSNSPSEFM